MKKTSAVFTALMFQGVDGRRQDSSSQSVESNEERYGGAGKPGGGRFPQNGNRGPGRLENGRPGQNSGGFPGWESGFNNGDFPAGGNRPNGGRPQGPNQGGFPQRGNGPNSEGGFLQGPGSGGRPSQGNRPSNNRQGFPF